MTGPTILVVDSDTDTREILRAYLESKGYTVCVASDGEEGLRRARAQRPDVVLGEFPLDVPGRSPFVAALRDEVGSTAPVVVFTARTGEADLAAARSISQCVILKPAAPSEVAKAVERLTGGATRRPDRSPPAPPEPEV